MNYLAIIFCVDSDSHESFTISRGVATLDKKTILTYMMEEAGVEDVDTVDTILVVQNDQRPRVIQHWSRPGGDFDGS